MLSVALDGHRKPWFKDVCQVGCCETLRLTALPRGWEKDANPTALEIPKGGPPSGASLLLRLGHHRALEPDTVFPEVADE